MESKEKCGVGGVVDLGETQNVVPIATDIAEGLQHRGELGAGIAWLRNETSPGRRIGTLTGEGLVKDVLKPIPLGQLGAVSQAAIVQTRYATNGSLDGCFLQPFHYPHPEESREFCFGFNGNIPDFHEQEAWLAERGIIPRFHGDTEIMGQMMVAHLQNGTEQQVRKIFQEALGTFDGAFNVVILTGRGDMCAIRDRHGFHPLVWGQQDSIVAVASEDRAIRDALPHAEIHDVIPGQMIEVNARTKRVMQHDLWTAEPRHCFFESIYFAGHRSKLDSASVSNARHACGKVLADMDRSWIDAEKQHGKNSEEWPIVVSVPDSAKTAANGYADRLGLRRVEVILKRDLAGRTFISPANRAEKALRKYDISQGLLHGKDIILIDDSMVRGTTMRVLIAELRKNGARKIHLRLASPPILAPCFYGIDFSTVGELIARKYSDGSLTKDGVLPENVLRAIAQDIDVDSLRYLPLTEVPAALEKKPDALCMACVTGEYPTPNGKELYKIANR